MERKQIKSQIKKIVEIQCPICYEQYDDDQLAPVIICNGQHCVCLKCINITFQMLDEYQPASCPICNQQFLQEDVSRFRLMDDVISITKLAENFQERKNQQIQALQKEKKQLEESLIQQKKLYQEEKKSKPIQIINKGRAKASSKKTLKTSFQDSPSKSFQSSRIKKTESFYLQGVKMRKQDHARILVYDVLKDEYKDETDLFLKPKQIQKNLNQYKYQLKPDQMKKCKAKKALPYLVNKKCVNANQLKQVYKRQNNVVKLPTRETCINILKRYDFSQVQILQLQGLNFNHQYFIPLCSNKHTLFRLQSINLSGNRLTQIPQFIFQLLNLKEINLNHNNLAQMKIETNVLPKLQRLLLWNNKLSTVPINMGDLKRLAELQLSNNCFKYLPESLLLIKTLKKINLFGNPIEDNETNRILLYKYEQRQIMLDIN